MSARHRLPPVLHPAAVQSRRHDHGLRPRHGRASAFARCHGRRARTSAHHQRHGRRRLLAQRPDQRRRQRRLQPQRQRDRRRRQQLHRGHRRPGHALVARRHTARAAPATRSSGRCAAWASSGCGQSTRTYRCRGDARRAARGADHEGERAEGDRRASGVHAQPAAPRASRWSRRRSTRGERVVRERFGVDSDTCTGDHSCIRLSGCPSLTIKRQSRSAAHRPGRDRPRQLRRLRRLRRGRARGGAVPVVLQGAHRQQSDRLGSLRSPACARPSSAALQRRDARRRARLAF